MELFWYNKSCACDNGRDTAGLCKGSTTDSDSVCEGSNPSPAAKESDLKIVLGRFLYFCDSTYREMGRKLLPIQIERTGCPCPA